VGGGWEQELQEFFYSHGTTFAPHPEKGGIPVRHRHFMCLKTLHHAMGESFGLWSAFKSHDSTQRFMHEALGLTLNGSHFQLANADACSVSAIQRHHHTVRHPAEIACIWT